MRFALATVAAAPALATQVVAANVLRAVNADVVGGLSADAAKKMLGLVHLDSVFLVVPPRAGAWRDNAARQRWASSAITSY